MFLLVNLNEILVSMQKEYKYNSYKYLSLIIIHIIKFWTDVTASVLIIFYLLLAFSKTCTGQGDLSIKKKVSELETDGSNRDDHPSALPSHLSTHIT